MKRLAPIIVFLLVVILVATGSYYFYFRGRDLTTGQTNISPYSAVALTSNELFFGHIKSENSYQLVLEDVYFFTYVPDPKATPAAGTNVAQVPTLIDTAAKDSLAPTSTYIINKAMIKYTYPLKNDSQVVKTIDNYKAKQ